MYQLFIDSDCDMSPEFAASFGAKMILMPYELDGKTLYPYADGTFDSKAYYDRLREGVIPKTFAISPTDYINYFEPYFAKGQDILYVHFSEKMSGTFNAMRLGLEELYEKYPERKVYTVDTRGITISYFLSALECCRLYKNGASIEEIMKWADENLSHIATYFFADDLKFFGASGRVSHFVALMGGMLSIKPIITISDEGIMDSVDKARGRKSAIEKIMNYVRDLQIDIDKHTIIIGHTDALDLVEELKQELINEFGDKLDVIVNVVNPTIGAHCGPNAVGVAFFGKHR